MSKTVNEALRRARVRSLHAAAERPREPDAAAFEAGYYNPDGECAPEAMGGVRTFYYVLELGPDERASLENIAGRYSYAQELLNSLEDDGRITEAGVWNARDALEDDTGKPWPSKLPLAGGALERKISKLFDEAV